MQPTGAQGNVHLYQKSLRKCSQNNFSKFHLESTELEILELRDLCFTISPQIISIHSQDTLAWCWTYYIFFTFPFF